MHERDFTQVGFNVSSEGYRILQSPRRYVHQWTITQSAYIPLQHRIFVRKPSHCFAVSAVFIYSIINDWFTHSYLGLIQYQWRNPKGYWYLTNANTEMRKSPCIIIWADCIVIGFLHRQVLILPVRNGLSVFNFCVFANYITIFCHGHYGKCGYITTY